MWTRHEMWWHLARVTYRVFFSTRPPLCRFRCHNKTSGNRIQFSYIMFSFSYIIVSYISLWLVISIYLVVHSFPMFSKAQFQLELITTRCFWLDLQLLTSWLNEKMITARFFYYCLHPFLDHGISRHAVFVNIYKFVLFSPWQNDNSWFFDTDYAEVWITARFLQ